MRLFIGIPLAAKVAAELAAVTRPLQSAEDGLRWIQAESWHITLDFLGTTKPDQYTCIVSRLRELQHAAVSIEFSEFGFFERAGVFILGVRLTAELASLQQSVAAVSAQCQFSPEDRPYQPHVTVARSKAGGAGLRALKPRIPTGAKPGAFTAKSFALYESLLGPSGSRYSIRETFLLTRSPPAERGE